MRYTDPDSPDSGDLNSSDARLRKEVEDLRRQLLEQQHLLDQRPQDHNSAVHHPRRPSAVGLWLLGVVILLVGVAAFFAGYLPHQQREAVVNAEARQQDEALPRVAVATVVSASHQSNLVLPGDLTAVTEAPILARSTGYVKSRLADIGDRVKEGQVLAEIEAPDVDQQVEQAKASLAQAQASYEQSNASLEQGKATLELARVTAARYGSLVADGIVAKQDNDQYQAQFKAQAASVAALQKAVVAAKSNIDASQANLNRLEDTKAFNLVKAPFSGVITVRNIEVGTLINAGSTLLYRIAQTGTLRAYVNVSQSDAASIHVGQAARLTISNLPGQSFPGRVARTASSLDPATRTLLVDVEVPNASGVLVPGMYTEVDFNAALANPPLVIPGESLIVRADGPQVAIVRPDHVVHFQKIQIGRDYGDHLDVTGGLHEGDLVVSHPSDNVREGIKVDPQVIGAKPGGRGN